MMPKKAPFPEAIRSCKRETRQAVLDVQIEQMERKGNNTKTKVGRSSTKSSGKVKAKRADVKNRWIKSVKHLPRLVVNSPVVKRGQSEPVEAPRGRRRGPRRSIREERMRFSNRGRREIQEKRFEHVSTPPLASRRGSKRICTPPRTVIVESPSSTSPLVRRADPIDPDSYPMRRSRFHDPRRVSRRAYSPQDAALAQETCHSPEATHDGDDDDGHDEDDDDDGRQHKRRLSGQPPRSPTIDTPRMPDKDGGPPRARRRSIRGSDVVMTKMDSSTDPPRARRSSISINSSHADSHDPPRARRSSISITSSHADSHDPPPPTDPPSTRMKKTARQMIYDADAAVDADSDKKRKMRCNDDTTREGATAPQRRRKSVSTEMQGQSTTLSGRSTGAREDHRQSAGELRGCDGSNSSSVHHERGSGGRVRTSHHVDGAAAAAAAALEDGKRKQQPSGDKMTKKMRVGHPPDRSPLSTIYEETEPSPTPAPDRHASRTPSSSIDPPSRGSKRSRSPVPQPDPPITSGMSLRRTTMTTATTATTATAGRNRDGRTKQQRRAEQAAFNRGVAAVPAHEDDAHEEDTEAWRWAPTRSQRLRGTGTHEHGYQVTYTRSGRASVNAYAPCPPQHAAARPPASSCRAEEDDPPSHQYHRHVNNKSSTAARAAPVRGVERSSTSGVLHVHKKDQDPGRHLRHTATTTARHHHISSRTRRRLEKNQRARKANANLAAADPQKHAASGEPAAARPTTSGNTTRSIMIRSSRTSSTREVVGSGGGGGAVGNTTKNRALPPRVAQGNATRRQSVAHLPHTRVKKTGMPVQPAAVVTRSGRLVTPVRELL